MASRATVQWQLNEIWGVDVSAYNWILLRRGVREDGKPGKWNEKGYYPSLDLLMKSFYRKLTRQSAKEPDLIKHVETCYKAAQSAAEQFFDQLKAEGLADIKRPSAPSGGLEHE